MSSFRLKSFYFGAAAHVGAAAVVLTAGAAGAQDTTSGKDARLSDVVVTASRVQTNLQKTPIAVTAISGEALRAHNITSLLDVQNFVPGFSVNSRSGYGAGSGGLAIRGIGVDASGSDASVGVYEDDVYVPQGVNTPGSGNLLGFYDIARVEVLRGPQGTLFGRNTIAGAVQYVTNQPESELGGYIDVIGGTDARLDYQGALNIPLGDRLALRIAGISTNQGGYVLDELNHIKRGASQMQGVRLKAHWTPTDRLTVDLKAEYQHESTNGRAVEVTAVNPFAPYAYGSGLNSSYVSTKNYTFAGFNQPDYFHYESKEVQAIVSYRITDSLTLKSISAYSGSQPRLAQDYDSTPLSIVANLPPQADLGVFTQEVQLNHQAPSDRLRWTIGGYYYAAVQHTNPGQLTSFGGGPFLDFFGGQMTDVRSWALYGQATYNLTPKLSATAGLRYSDETNTTWLVGGPPAISTNFTDVSPYFGLNYQVDPDVMLYAKASKGFRAGGTTVELALPSGGFPYTPETAWTYEVGARAEFLDHRLRINPTAFLTKWSGIQFNYVDPPFIFATANAGTAQVAGFELESQFVATDRLTLNASLALLDAHYTTVDQGAFIDITLHSQLEHAPRVKFNVGGQYTYPLPRDSDLVATVNYAWTDNQRSATADSQFIQIPAYGLLNGRIQYDSPGHKWSVAVFGTNLTDQFYLLGGASFLNTVGVTTEDIGQPREVGVELKAHF